MLQYAEVLVDVANRRLDQVFHYLVPENLKLKIGMRVLVPLQYRQVQGLVVGLTDRLPEELADKALRPVTKIVGSAEIPQELIELACWMAETTICPVAQALHTVWPLLKGKVEEWVVPLAAKDDPDVQALKLLDPEIYKTLSTLYRARQNALPLKIFLQRADITKQKAEELVKHGWIKTEMRFVSRLPQISANKSPDSVNQTEIIRLDEDNNIQSRELTFEQSEAAAKIIEAMNLKKFQTVLLHGVTGSGKTEVYREVINRIMEEGGDAILLVPEISLTSQIAVYFEKLYGSQLAVLHSGLSAGEKVRAWEEIYAGKKRLVIGARSAVFAPLPNLRLIILDEEHDSAYKQDEAPKYHAREVARKRMEQRGGIVVLGSATPSLEAYAAAQAGKIGLAAMTKRVGERPLPPVEIVDMREELLRGNRNIFSLALQTKLRERLERGEQSMLFLNRRGYSTFVMCRECGHVVKCRDCDVSLTYHVQGHVMRCHYCNHEELPPHYCPQCGSRYIRFFGQGTQRVEEELHGLFPEAQVLRLDWDTTRSKDAHQAILEKFRRQEASILVGTQMMAKGLDFPNVTLVGVVAADQILNMPDFRARERTFQLLTQVAGRAGRSEKRGEVVIQTYSPADRAILRASQHDYPGFFWEELQYRKERRYPPFTHVIRVTLLHEKEERVIRAAHVLADSLRQGLANYKTGNNDLDILGPAPAVLPRLKNMFRWQVAVKGKNLEVLRNFLHSGVKIYSHNPSSSGVNLSIEVDPLST